MKKNIIKKLKQQIVKIRDLLFDKIILVLLRIFFKIAIYQNKKNVKNTVIRIKKKILI